MISPLRIIGLLCITAATSGAEEVWLNDNDRASGHIVTLNSQGITHVQSPLTSEPIRLHSSAIRKIDFATTREDSSQDMQLDFADGGSLFCTVKDADATHLNLTSPVLGAMRLPRAALRALNFGVAPMRPIYQSKDTVADWQTDRGWEIQKDALCVRGAGQISRAVKLPATYQMRCTVSWRESVNLRMFVASNTGNDNPSMLNRYYVHLHPGGLDVRRQSAEGDRRYTPLYSSNRNPEEFRDNKCEISLRFDRQSSTLYLYLNGQLEARISDPITPPLEGKRIGFEAFDGDSGVRVTDIEVREWDATSERYRTAERGNDQLDALIDSQGQRWSGQLTGMSTKDNALKLNFKASDQATPLTPTSKQVATLFFTKAEAGDANHKQWKLQLLDGSTLFAANCEITEQRINFTHPTLGNVSLPRQAMLAIERMPAPKP